MNTSLNVLWIQVIENYPPILDLQLGTKLANNQLFRPKPTNIPTKINILIIKNLKNTSSYGNDEIAYKYIKDANVIIAPYVTVIFKTSIVTGIVPDLWKMAIIIPLYKKPSNYRPISLLSVSSKII